MEEICVMDDKLLRARCSLLLASPSTQYSTLWDVQCGEHSASESTFNASSTDSDGSFQSIVLTASPLCWK